MVLYMFGSLSSSALFFVGVRYVFIESVRFNRSHISFVGV